jgi:D-alanine-D-alanine ligase
LGALRRRLKRARPDVVFNRVESLGGTDALMAIIPLLLESMYLPYTGCTAEALAATASKLVVKQRLLEAGLPTPAWITADGKFHGDSDASAGRAKRAQRGNTFILKSVYEHASFQLDDSSLCKSSSHAGIAQAVRRCEARTDRPFFAEQFVDGREFNLSVWGAAPEVLPPAEIDFSALPVGKPHIVNRGAKWDAATYEYRHTPRRFDFPPADGQLLNELKRLTRDSARLFNIRGYARVDFRCDLSGQPWILEVNSNPCLSPDAGFIAALERAGYDYESAISRLLEDAITASLPTSIVPSRRRRGALPGSTPLNAASAGAGAT